MKANQLFRGSRIEVSINGNPGISKILHWDEKRQEYVDPRSIKGCNAMPFRAVKRVKVLGKSKKVQAKFFSLDEARAWRLAAGSEDDVPITKGNSYTLLCLINDWSKWVQNHLEESTLEVYEQDVGHMKLLYDVSVEDIQAQDIDYWIEQLIDPSYPKPKSRQSFKREVKTLKTILNWYRQYKNSKYQHPVLKRHLNDCVFTKEARKIKLPLTEGELEKFLERLRTHSQKPVYYYLASFQALTGTRIGEACGLKWNDIDFANSRVLIRQIVRWEHKSRNPVLRAGTKTGKERVIKICPRLFELLLEWEKISKDGDFVFTADGQFLSYPAVQNAYNKAFRALGLSQRSTHCLRRTFATIHANQTGDICATKDALGHTDFRTTQIYARTSEINQEKALEKFELGKLKAKAARHEVRISVDDLVKKLDPTPDDPQDGTTN